MKKVLPLVLFFILGSQLKAQDTLYVKDSVIMDQKGNAIVFSSYNPEDGDDKRPSPYKTSWRKDGPITAGLIGLNVLGVYLVNKKKKK